MRSPSSIRRALAAALAAASLPLLVVRPALASCPRYGRVQTLGTIHDTEINEISGLVASQRYAHTVWAEEDSGNLPVVYGFDTDGHRVARITLSAATNRDWEDIAFADGNVYVGDIGDNGHHHDSSTIYRIPEPHLGTRSVTPVSFTIRYRGGISLNAEAMFVVRGSDQLFIITKETGRAEVFRVDIGGARRGDEFVMRRVATLPLDHVTSADIDRSAIIIKNGTAGYLYPRGGTRNVVAALNAHPCTVPVKHGEAIGFSRNGHQYYMIPEGADPQVTASRRR